MGTAGSGKRTRETGRPSTQARPFYGGGRIVSVVWVCVYVRVDRDDKL